MNIEPTEKHILVKPIMENSQTNGGVFVGEKEKDDRGIVLAAGDKVEYVSKDNIIIFKKVNAIDVDVDGSKCFIITEDEVFAIVRE